MAYGLASYIKGAVYLQQLAYVIGKDNMARAMRRYYSTWQFKHPNPTDLLRIMEKESGLELDWYNEYFVQTTKTVDYAVGSVVATPTGNGTEITLQRLGKMPMPIDLLVTYADGRREVIYIPLDMMRGTKANETPELSRTTTTDWVWTEPKYAFIMSEDLKNIAKVEIDPTGRMADIVRTNNVWEAGK
jgi:aminopeptidase N